MLTLLKKQLKTVNTRTFHLFGFLVATVLFNLYFNHVYKPHKEVVVSLKKELWELTEEMITLKSQIPETEEIESSLAKRRNDY